MSGQSGPRRSGSLLILNRILGGSNAIPATGVTWYPVEAANITRVTTSDPGHAVGWAVDPDAPYSPISVRATVTFWTWGCVSWMYNACYQQGEVPVYSASSAAFARNPW